MIELSGITKTYADGHCALRGIDLQLEDDGVFGLLGPNGAGKTTLLSILVLTLEQTDGRRIYDGLDAMSSRLRPAIRKTIGYLPQDFHPIGHLTGLEFLVHCGRLRGVPRRVVEKRARLLLGAVDLVDASSRATSTYSGGMRRRLGIAQAMIHAPKLLVVDEPTAGLDPDERIRFRNLIAEAAEEVAVVLSTHIVEDIEATCDRIGVLAGGRFTFIGRPSTMIENSNRATLEDAYSDQLAPGRSVA